MHIYPDPFAGKTLFQDDLWTTSRPVEVLEARIELWNRNRCEITFPKTKGKYNRWTMRKIPGAPKTMKLTTNTNEMLRNYVSNRKKGHIFINEKTGKKLTLRHFEKEIDKWARMLNVQKLQSIKPGGNLHSTVKKNNISVIEAIMDVLSGKAFIPNIAE